MKERLYNDTVVELDRESDESLINLYDQMDQEMDKIHANQERIFEILQSRRHEYSAECGDESQE